MPCRSPLQGYKLPNGTLSFNRSNSTGLLTFACGMCRDCRLHKAREWAIRCYHETSMHEHNCWLTLTFEHNPVTVGKSDLQIFFKALRHAGHKFSYYAVGEYGEKLSRPHYHVCLFGTDFPDKYPFKKSKGGLLYRSPKLEKAWTHGHASISELTMENAGYTARYTMKKINGEMADDHYIVDYHGVDVKVHPEFALMSLKPPIGKRWIEKYWKDVFPLDHVIYKGKECPTPRYYYNWLQVHHPDVWKIVQAKRIAAHLDAEYTTGKELHDQAHARDCKTKTLNNRNLGNDSRTSQRTA